MQLFTFGDPGLAPGILLSGQRFLEERPGLSFRAQLFFFPGIPRQHFQEFITFNYGYDGTAFASDRYPIILPIFHPLFNANYFDTP